jgi:hypothetical protein
MNIYFSVTIAFHLLATALYETYHLCKRWALVVFLLIAGNASATSLSLPGYIWGQATTSTIHTSVAQGALQQGIQYKSFPLVPYIEADYYGNSMGSTSTELVPTTTFLGGVYAKLWNTPFRISAAYVYDKTQGYREQVYITLYKEWK